MAKAKYTQHFQEWVELYNSGHSFNKISKMFNVARGTVSSLLDGHVDERPKKQFEHVVHDWIELYVNQMWSLRDIAGKYDVSTSTVSSYLKKHIELREGFSGTERLFVHLESEWVDLYHYGYSLSEIANMYDVSIQTVKNYVGPKIELRNYSESQKSSYAFQQDIFECIDTNEKSYWLGYIYANGHLVERRKDRGFSLATSKNYMEQLEAFKAFVCSEKPIQLNKDGTANIRILNPILFTNLQQQGMQRNKKLLLQFPLHLPQHLIKSFIFGYFEGKGYVTYYRTKKTLSFNGTTELILELQKQISNYFEGLSYTLNETTSKGLRITYTKESEVMRLFEWLYQDQTYFSLKRKHELEELLQK